MKVYTWSQNRNKKIRNKWPRETLNLFKIFSEEKVRILYYPIIDVSEIQKKKKANKKKAKTAVKGSLR